MSETNPYQSPEFDFREQVSTTEPAQPGPVGLGGWLILVAIRVIIAPIAEAVMLYVSYVPLFTDGTWEAVTTPGSEYYIPNWGALVIGELVATVVFLLCDLAMLYLFFNRKRLFPKLYITLLLFTLIYGVIDWVLGSIVLSGPMLESASLQPIIQTAVGAAIWVPYLLVSKRVKNTFVE